MEGGHGDGDRRGHRTEGLEREGRGGGRAGAGGAMCAEGGRGREGVPCSVRAEEAGQSAASCLSRLDIDEVANSS